MADTFFFFFFTVLFGLGKCNFWLISWQFFPHTLKTTKFTNFHRPHSVFSDSQGLKKLIPFSPNFQRASKTVWTLSMTRQILPSVSRRSLKQVSTMPTSRFGQTFQTKARYTSRNFTQVCFYQLADDVATFTHLRQCACRFFFNLNWLHRTQHNFQCHINFTGCINSVTATPTISSDCKNKNKQNPWIKPTALIYP